MLSFGFSAPVTIGIQIAPSSDTSYFTVSVLNLIIPVVAVAGLSTVVPLGRINAVEFDMTTLPVPAVSISKSALLEVVDNLLPENVKSPKSAETDEPSMVNVSPSTVATNPPVPTMFNVFPSGIDIVEEVLSPKLIPCAWLTPVIVNVSPVTDVVIPVPPLMFNVVSKFSVISDESSAPSVNELFADTCVSTYALRHLNWHLE
jgi:hypothetical protein